MHADTNGTDCAMAPLNELVAKSLAAGGTGNRLDFCPSRDAINVDYSAGGVIEVPGPDGSILKLRKIDTTYDPSNRINATTHIAQAAGKGEVLTGLLYLASDAEGLHSHLNTYETVFNKLGETDLCPGAGMLERINSGLR